MFLNEENLKYKLKEGDHEAFHFLFKTYHKTLVLYALSLLKDQASSEDLVQEVFLSIWKKRETININFSIKNYLFRSVHNAFINDHKKKLKKKSLLADIQNEAIYSVIENDEDFINEKLRLIENEINRLPKKTRKIFIMNKRRGLRGNEIAEMLNLSEKTVESHLYRALKRLRANLSNLISLFFIIF